MTRSPGRRVRARAARPRPLGVIADPGALHVAAAAARIGFGVFRFLRPRWHPRWTTMRVDRRELTWWSFLMSSAHGAGLMVAPVLLGGATAGAADGHDLAMAGRAPVAAFIMAGVITLFT